MRDDTLKVMQILLQQSFTLLPSDSLSCPRYLPYLFCSPETCKFSVIDQIAGLPLTSTEARFSKDLICEGKSSRCGVLVWSHSQRS